MGGGCIAHAARVETNRGTLFLKSGVDRVLLAMECKALQELRPARVPEVIALSAEGEREAWLLLEWLEPGTATSHGWSELGRMLAEIHRRTAAQFGWTRDNFIGSLPQSNKQNDDWVGFWREQRILPQLEKGALKGRDAARIEKLLGRADEIIGIGNEEGASMLHGDLWGGNIHACSDGGIALIDPSLYYGHREVDLAMAALFGGFDEKFWRSYEDAWPLRHGAAARRHMYQLYYMLVHVNLFGVSYLAGTMSLVERLGF